MKIGIMLRHSAQHRGGVKNYTDYILNELFSMDSSHEFVLIYNNSKFIGLYKGYKNVREVAVNIPSRLLWDQIGVPWIQKKENIDIIFNPKYSLPLAVNCPTIFVCHGLDWYLMPWGSRKIDALSHKFAFPRYASKASLIIAVSETTKEHLIKFLNVNEKRIHTIYEGVHESFRQEISKNKLQEVKQKYEIPEKFFLFSGQIYPPKNFGRLLQAYAQVGPKLGVSLVVAGEHRWLCDKELEMIDKLGISQWVKRPGWIDNKELISFYKMAEALVFPSLYESFGSPIVEAMAAGCPVITSNRFGTKEVAGDAAILVDPEDLDSISEGMSMILTEKDLRNELILKGYKRSKQFSWNKCARSVLETLEEAARLPRVKDSSIKVFRLQKKYRGLIIEPPSRNI